MTENYRKFALHILAFGLVSVATLCFCFPKNIHDLFGEFEQTISVEASVSLLALRGAVMLSVLVAVNVRRLFQLRDLS